MDAVCGLKQPGLAAAPEAQRGMFAILLSGLLRPLAPPERVYACPPSTRSCVSMHSRPLSLGFNTLIGCFACWENRGARPLRYQY